MCHSDCEDLYFLSSTKPSLKDLLMQSETCANACCACMCVWACFCLSVALTPGAKSGGGELCPLSVSLYRHWIVVSSEERKHLHSCQCESSIVPLSVTTAQDVLEPQLNFEIYKSSRLTFNCPPHSLYCKESQDHLSLPFPVVVCFLVFLDQVLQSLC